MILTGTKNNAGDFLIRFRALALFKALRSDRDIVNYNNWERFSDEQLEVINGARALILTGGPSIRPNMWPDLFPLTDDLDKIKVPILTMGSGWKSAAGTWEDTHHYEFNRPTTQLLTRVNESGFLSSVRDYHTMNALRHQGYDNFMMTGCPAYYDLDRVGREPDTPGPLRRVSFSTGLTFASSPSMKSVMQDSIVALHAHFRDDDFKVVFHQSLDFFDNMSAAHKRLADEHRELAGWLDARNIAHTNISGSAENLINHYRERDLHVGFRIHAHLFMCSVSRPTILISEDGRAPGVRGTVGGIVFDGFNGYKSADTVREQIIKKFVSSSDPFVPNTHLAGDLVRNIAYEQQMGYPRIVHQVRSAIDENFNVMKSYLKQLP